VDTSPGFRNIWNFISNSDGSIVIAIDSGESGVTSSHAPKLHRFVIDTTTGMYRKTHSVTAGYTMYSGSGQKAGGTIMGDYVYIRSYNNAVSSVAYRYDLADLANEASMSGATADANWPAMFNDGTYIYMMNNNSTYYKYSVSGTTLTYLSNTGYSYGGSISLTPYCDGTYVYQSSQGKPTTLTKRLLSNNVDQGSTDWSSILKIMTNYGNTNSPRWCGGIVLDGDSSVFNLVTIEKTENSSGANFFAVLTPVTFP
jgi:hypothetical protein